MKASIINAIQHVLNNDNNLSKESRVKLEEALAKAKASKTNGDIKDVLKHILFFIRYLLDG